MLAAVQAFAVHAKLLPAAPTAGVTPLAPHALVPEAVYPVLQVGVHDAAVRPPTVLVQSPTAPLAGTALKSHVFSLHSPAVTTPAAHESALVAVYPALHVSAPLPPLDRVPAYDPMVPVGFVEPVQVILAVVDELTAALMFAAVQAFAVHAKLLPTVPAPGVTPLAPHALVPEAVYPVLQVGVHAAAVRPPTVLVQSPTAPLVGTALKSHVFTLHDPIVITVASHLVVVATTYPVAQVKPQVAPEFIVPAVTRLAHAASFVPCVGCTLASVRPVHGLPWQTGLVSTVLVQVDVVPTLVKSDPHVGVQVLPEAIVSLQSPMPPLVGAVTLQALEKHPQGVLTAFAARRPRITSLWKSEGRAEAKAQSAQRAMNFCMFFSRVTPM